MTYEVDPLRDPHWRAFVESHARSSIFHTPEWLEALSRTYGFQPLAVTTSARGEDLKNGLVFCSVKNWRGGRRMVSLPFSDHCEPLVDGDDLERVLSALKDNLRAGKSRQIELRPVTAPAGLVGESGSEPTFWLHRLDLRPSLEDLFRGFHKDCVQRCIRRAERERLAHEEGRSEELLRSFYRLTVLTRRRQHLPPQPLPWFRNLVQAMGDRLTIHLASKDGKPVASILTLRHKGTLTYKYGCSDKSLGSLGGMQFLFWKAIQEAKTSGLVEFDLGRTDLDNPGLIAFKDRWGASRSSLVYLRFPVRRSHHGGGRLGVRIAKQLFSVAPDCVLTTAGRFLYRYFA
jgi:CelD/BcsL family acetyltransferase involved in cellulose biosynthesis